MRNEKASKWILSQFAMGFLLLEDLAGTQQFGWRPVALDRCTWSAQRRPKSAGAPRAVKSRPGGGLSNDGSRWRWIESIEICKDCVELKRFTLCDLNITALLVTLLPYIKANDVARPIRVVGPKH